ncbi:MAG: sensor histidine kinase [Rhodoglobus sp.]
METWTRPRPAAAGYSRDALSAVVLAVSAGLSAGLYNRLGIYTDPAPLWLSILAIAAYTLPLALRRRYPVVVAVIVSAAFFVAGQFRVPESLFVNIALFLAIYTVGAWSSNRRRAIIVRGAIVLFMFAWISTNLVATIADPALMPHYSRSGVFSQLAAFAVIQIITNLLYFIGAWVFGNAMWESARQRSELADAAAELTAEREFSSAQAVALDRVRIARELHDVVAHHVSVMGLQAGAARRLMPSDPTAASGSLEIVEKSAREAVDELHRLLSTLRDGDGDTASTSVSTRRIAQLPELVAAARAAGTPTVLQIVGEPFPLSALTGFTLYRVAQESLTNVRKHAGASASAEVRLRYTESGVELEIADTGGGRATNRPAGLGQLGMRERLNAVGGSIEFSRRRNGGYLVRAAIPLAGATS